MIHSVKNNNYQRILPIKRHITIDVLLVYMSSLSTNSANEVERVYTTFRCQHFVLSRKRPHLLKNKLKHYYAITVSKFYWCLDSLTLSHILGSMTPEFFVLEQALQVIKKTRRWKEPPMLVLVWHYERREEERPKTPGKNSQCQHRPHPHHREGKILLSTCFLRSTQHCAQSGPAAPRRRREPAPRQPGPHLPTWDETTRTRRRRGRHKSPNHWKQLLLG